MTIKSTCVAAVVAVAALASSAQAATYVFSGSTASDLGVSEVFSADGAPDVTAWAGSSGLLNDGLATLTQDGNGLGVNGRFDLNPWQIDGFPVGSSEFITFTFARAVNLLTVYFRNVDRNDQFDYSINGEDFVNSVTIGTDTKSFDFNREGVMSLVIRASGTLFTDGAGNDDFSIRKIDVAAVPLPAGGLLLLGALGGLAVLRRRKA